LSFETLFWWDNVLLESNGISSVAELDLISSKNHDSLAIEVVVFDYWQF